MKKIETEEKIPRFGKFLLWAFLNDEDLQQALGDLNEAFIYQIKINGKRRALFWLWWQIIRSLPVFILDCLYWSINMIKNYFKIALRVITRQKMFSLLNVIGLGLSLICGMLIFFHVKEELSYERCYPKSERIYRLQTDSQYGSTFRHWAASAPALGPMLLESFPEIEATVRIRDLGTEILSYRPENEPVKRFEETWGFLAEPSVFTIFDLDLLAGNAQTALTDPQSIVLTESMSERYFGNENPLGKTLFNERLREPLKVTGIITDFPRNSHLKIDYLVSLPTFLIYIRPLGLDESAFNHRTWKSFYTYVLLRQGQTTESFAQKIPAFTEDYYSEFPGRREEFSLQPIRDIHLHSRLEGEISSNSDMAYVYIFIGVAVLILTIAGVNFVNLSTAQSFKRMKEIGVRKVIGARKGQLIKQHLGESFLISVLASLFTVICLNFALPLYNQITGRSISFREVFTIENAVFFMLLMILLSCLAGLYPAFFASGFHPINTIKSIKDPRSTATRLRKGLVVFQFVISIFLIFCTITMYRQLAFFHNKDLGFDKEKIISLRLYGDFGASVVKQPETLKAEILRNPDVSQVALTSSLPGTSFSNERLTPVYVEDKNTLPMLRFVRVDEDFIDTLGLKLVQGRNFDKGSDQGIAYIVSESVVEMLNLEQPLGIQCRSDIHSGTAPIVGVIKDFHHSSLHNPIEPLVLEYNPGWAGNLLVKVRDTRFNEVLGFLMQKFNEIAPDFLFQYQFVDDVFNHNYDMEEKSFDLFRAFSILALFVACLGLLGLAVYAAEVRTREIGIRKVLGASVPNIMMILSSEFVRWVLLANVVAWPLAYLAMHKWLENFAFRVEINVWTFVLSAALAFVFAVGTVGYQAIKTASTNPVKSLRYE
jgi:putative ABC transport system permease protein